MSSIDSGDGMEDGWNMEPCGWFHFQSIAENIAFILQTLKLIFIFKIYYYIYPYFTILYKITK